MQEFSVLDKNRDGVVTIDEILSFLERRVSFHYLHLGGVIGVNTAFIFKFECELLESLTALNRSLRTELPEMMHPS